jgi:hypothetical protein
MPPDMSNIGLNGVQHLVDMTGKDQFAPGQSEPHDHLRRRHSPRWVRYAQAMDGYSLDLIGEGND